MLKTRLIPTLLYKDTTLVKGIGYDSWRRVGMVMQSIKVYNMREVDELIFLDITATLSNRDPDFDLIDDIADEIFVPFTVGGGIRSIEDVRHLLQVGADKVSICTAAVKTPHLITEIADYFGSQCCVVSIDVKQTGEKYEVYTHAGTISTGLNPIKFAQDVEQRGAGEILLNSIDLDGTMKGYDLRLIKSITENVSIPVIASGGCGNYQHMLDAIKIGNASALAAASIFHFTEQTPIEAKIFLKNHGIDTRTNL